MITQGELQELISYDPETGIVRRLTGPRAGEIAGKEGHQGYVTISINGRGYRRGRLAWFYMTGAWPKALIDHRNGKRSDDRFCNLREATPAENIRNSRRKRKSGLKGAFWHKRDQRWRAQIYMDSKPIHLGYFDTELEAYEAYCEAARKLHGEFARFA